ncbi:MAG TPA: T9SS type A sorting domain-containing protein, partial [Cryomorphaceae bacterium]|nr:T9SS type A sorting domain-containing protein [Cryomorphaceae bacterium]
LLMDPEDPEKLFVTSSQGLFVTADGGETWEQQLSGFLRDVAIHPGNSEIVYTTGTSFYRSDDGGENFQQITDGLPSPGAVNRLEMAVTEANDQLVYIVAGDSDDSGFQGFYRSSDEGISFELMSNSPNLMGYSETGDSEGGQSWYDLAIAASPTDEDRVFVGGINVWETADGGNSWNIKSHWVYPSNIGYTHADIHSLDFFGNTIYCGSDGGVFRSENNAQDWEDLSEGLQISQYYRIAVSVGDPDKILAGSQDNGTNLFSNESGYVHLLGGDGNGASIDYTNDDIMYASYPGGNYQRSTDGGLNFNGFTGSISETGAWVTPFEIHPNDPNILFAAYENVWKYEDNSWTAISDLGVGTTLRAMRVAPSDPDVILASTFQLLYKTEDGGDTWDEISTGLPDLFITAIEIDPQDSERIWVAYSGYEDGQKVFFTENGGDTWENRTENLPNVPVNCLHYLQGSNDGIYAGTDVGVFYIDGELENWSPYSEGLPNVIVNQLVFHYPSQQIFLASFGRGVWKNGFFNSDELAPIPNFSAANTAICPDAQVNFTNLSLNATDGVEWAFEGGEPEVSTDSDPTITYSEPGFYSVKLKAFNGAQVDSLSISNYIQVLNNQPAPFVEDFESQTEDLVGWNASDPIQDITWELLSDIGYLSEQSVYIQNYDLVGNGQIELVSELIDLSQLDTAFISMRVAFARKLDSSYEALRIFIDTDCSNEWDLLKVFSASSSLASVEPTNDYFEPQGEEEWNYLVADNIEPEERTENFRFKLVFYYNGGNNIYLDDINLNEDNLLNTQFTSTKFDGDIELFPNPTSGDINIVLTAKKAEKVSLNLLGADGKLLLQDGPLDLIAGKQNLGLSMGALDAGTYILEVVGESGVVHRKIILTGE